MIKQKLVAVNQSPRQVLHAQQSLVAWLAVVCDGFLQALQFAVLAAEMVDNLGLLLGSPLFCGDLEQGEDGVGDFLEVDGALVRRHRQAEFAKRVELGGGKVLFQREYDG